MQVSNEGISSQPSSSHRAANTHSNYKNQQINEAPPEELSYVHDK